MMARFWLMETPEWNATLGSEHNSQIVALRWMMIIILKILQTDDDDDEHNYSVNILSNRC